MKRVNVFLSEKDLEILREHREEIRKLAGNAPWKTVAVADLIRFAISQTWGTRYKSLHIQSVILRAYLNDQEKNQPDEGESAIIT